VKDQAETLRNLMRARLATKRDDAIAIHLAPETRKNRLFSPRELAMQNRKLGGALRIRDASDPIVVQGGSSEIRAHLAVLSADERDLVGCYQIVKNQSLRGGVKKMDIIVCGVDDDVDGRRVFTKLFDVCARFLDIHLVYAGAIGRGEKIRDSVAVSNFLLHYQGRAGSLIGR
jgi:hypothetical protein